MARVNLSKGRIQKTIDLLSLESPAPVAKQGTRWQLTAAILAESFWERAERLTALRRCEQQQMQEYVDLAEGHMAFLLRSLDGDSDATTPPTLPRLATDVDPTLVREAVEFLRRTSIPIEPRKKWPSGGLPFHAFLEKTENRPEQKTMANSIQQARNVDGSIAIAQEPLPSGPVILLDDMVDSRWTLTVCAWLLRTRGSGEVWPIALAMTGNSK